MAIPGRALALSADALRAAIAASPTLLAALLSAAIIVGQPNPLMDGIHDRMPVVLTPGDYDRWLDPAISVDDLRKLLKAVRP